MVSNRTTQRAVLFVQGLLAELAGVFVDEHVQVRVGSHRLIAMPVVPWRRAHLSG